MNNEFKRMQELAGVFVNEEEQKEDPVALYLRQIQKDIMDLVLVTDRFYGAWNDDPTPGSLTKFDPQEGGRIERQPSWKVAMERFTGKDMYNYLFFKVSEMSNGLDLDKGNLDKYLDSVLDEMLRRTKGDFNIEALVKAFPNSSSYIGQLGSGNVQKDKDILAKLLTVDNSFLSGGGGYGNVGKLKSPEELYKDFKDGTLFSSSFENITTVREEKLNNNKMKNEFKRMQKLSGVPVKEEKENLNEHYIAGGIVGVGAINNPFEGRKKESYEDAFEYFLSKKYSLKEAEEEVEEGIFSAIADFFKTNSLANYLIDEKGVDKNTAKNVFKSLQKDPNSESARAELKKVMSADDLKDFADYAKNPNRGPKNPLVGVGLKDMLNLVKHAFAGTEYKDTPAGYGGEGRGGVLEEKEEVYEAVGSSIERMIDGAKFEFSQKGNDEMIELANYILTPEGAKNVAMSLKNRLKGEGGENYFATDTEALQALLAKLK